MCKEYQIDKRKLWGPEAETASMRSILEDVDWTDQREPVFLDSLSHWLVPISFPEHSVLGVNSLEMLKYTHSKKCEMECIRYGSCLQIKFLCFRYFTMHKSRTVKVSS